MGTRSTPFPLFSALQAHVLFLGLVSALGLITSQPALCQERAAAGVVKPEDDRVRKIINLFRESKCQAAWDFYWKGADTKDDLASSIMLDSLVFFAIIINGPSDDKINKITFPLRFYGLLYKESETSKKTYGNLYIKEIRTVLADNISFFIKDKGRKNKIYACLKSEKEMRLCIDIAVSENIIPNYKEYVEYVRSTKESASVFCNSSLIQVPVHKKD